MPTCPGEELHVIPCAQMVGGKHRAASLSAKCIRASTRLLTGLLWPESRAGGSVHAQGLASPSESGCSAQCAFVFPGCLPAASVFPSIEQRCRYDQPPGLDESGRGSSAYLVARQNVTTAQGQVGCWSLE